MTGSNLFLTRAERELGIKVREAKRRGTRVSFGGGQPGKGPLTALGFS